MENPPMQMTRVDTIGRKSTKYTIRKKMEAEKNYTDLWMYISRFISIILLFVIILMGIGYFIAYQHVSQELRAQNASNIVLKKELQSLKDSIETLRNHQIIVNNSARNLNRKLEDYDVSKIKTEVITEQKNGLYAHINQINQTVTQRISAINDDIISVTRNSSNLVNLINIQQSRFQDILDEIANLRYQIAQMNDSVHTFNENHKIMETVVNNIEKDSRVEHNKLQNISSNIQNFNNSLDIVYEKLNYLNASLDWLNSTVEHKTSLQSTRLEELTNDLKTEKMNTALKFNETLLENEKINVTINAYEKRCKEVEVKFGREFESQMAMIEKNNKTKIEDDVQFTNKLIKFENMFNTLKNDQQELQLAMNAINASAEKLKERVTDIQDNPFAGFHAASISATAPESSNVLKDDVKNLKKEIQTIKAQVENTDSEINRMRSTQVTRVEYDTLDKSFQQFDREMKILSRNQTIMQYALQQQDNKLRAMSSRIDNIDITITDLKPIVKNNEKYINRINEWRINKQKNTTEKSS